MSYNNVIHVHHTASLVDYLVYGNGDKKKAHVEAGTHRIACARCDVGGVEDFVEHCDRVMKSHSRRRIQCHSVVQAFPAGEFDPTNTEDLDRMNSLGYRLAHRLAPGAAALVISHVDGESGCPHNHILVANEDRGRAVTCMSVAHVRATNNELMREEGLEVLNERCDEWAEKRPRVHSEIALFLGDNVNEALKSSSSMEEFTAELASRGITIRDKRRNGEPLEGWRYETTKFNDPEGRRKAPRGHKASGLCAAFTKESVAKLFQQKRAEGVAVERDEAAVNASGPAAASRVEVEPIYFGVAETRECLEALYEETYNRRQRGKGKYAKLNREMRRLLAANGRESFAAMTRDMHDETRRRVIEIERRQDHERGLRERPAVETALGTASRDAMKKGDVLVAILLLMLQWRLEDMRMKMLEMESEAITELRPLKWDAENRENAAVRVLAEYDEFVQERAEVVEPFGVAETREPENEAEPELGLELE